MLNLDNLYTIIKNNEFLPENRWDVCHVTALIEQRIVLERIAELLDVARLNWADIGSQLDRIAVALEVIVSEDEPDDKSGEDEPDGDQPKTALIK